MSSIIYIEIRKIIINENSFIHNCEIIARLKYKEIQA